MKISVKEIMKSGKLLKLRKHKLVQKMEGKY